MSTRTQARDGSGHVESVDPRFQVVSAEPPRRPGHARPVKTRFGIPVAGRDEPDAGGSRCPAGRRRSPDGRRPRARIRRRPGRRRSRPTWSIEPNGLDVDRDVELIPVDALGDRLTPVDVEPATAQVTIAVFSDLESQAAAGDAGPRRDTRGGLRGRGDRGRSADRLGRGRRRRDPRPDRGADRAGVRQRRRPRTSSRTSGLTCPRVSSRPAADSTVTVTRHDSAVAATRSLRCRHRLVGTRPASTTASRRRTRSPLVGGPDRRPRPPGAARTFELWLDVGGLGPGTHEVHAHGEPAGRADARRRRAADRHGDDHDTVAASAPHRRRPRTCRASSARTGSAASPTST